MHELYIKIAASVHMAAVPLAMVALYRLIVCKAELGRIRKMREKQSRFLSCRSQYTEMGGWICLLPVLVLSVLLPMLWPLWLAAAITLSALGAKKGRQKAAVVDAHWREVGLAMKATDPDRAVETEEPEALLTAADFIPDTSTPAPAEENDTIITEEHT